MKELIKLMRNIKTEKEMESFLRGLLTPQEIETLLSRIQIVKLIKKGTPHHDIAEKLGVGVGTVTRGSREIKKGRFQNI